MHAEAASSEAKVECKITKFTALSIGCSGKFRNQSKT